MDSSNILEESLPEPERINALIFLDIYIARENEEARRKNLPLFFAFVQRVLLDGISNLSKNNCTFLKHF